MTTERNLLPLIMFFKPVNAPDSVNSISYQSAVHWHRAIIGRFSVFQNNLILQEIKTFGKKSNLQTQVLLVF